MRRTHTKRAPLPKRSEKVLRQGPEDLHIEVQEQWIAEQICVGVPVYKLIPQTQLRFQLNKAQARARYEAVRERWVAEDKAQIEKWKAEAQRRIFTGMADARTQLKDKPQAMHATLLRYEDQLAKIQGTYAPVKIDIDVTVSQHLVGVVANLTADQVMEHINDWSETQRLASEYKRLSSDNAAE
jgi:hypothetical protein